MSELLELLLVVVLLVVQQKLSCRRDDAVIPTTGEFFLPRDARSDLSGRSNREPLLYHRISLPFGVQKGKIWHPYTCRNVVFTYNKGTNSPNVVL